MNKKPSYSISHSWDKRGLNPSTKLSRIVLSVNIFGHGQFIISLNLRSTQDEYLQAISSKRQVSEKVTSIRKHLHEYTQKADEIFNRLPNPTKKTFTRLFKSDTDLSVTNKTAIKPFFQQKIDKFFSEEKFSSSRSYTLALKSFTKYKANLTFEDINKEFLKAYTHWMINKNNCSITTANMYLRNLKVIFNEAIAEGYISDKHYPFKGYKLGSQQKSKGVLYPEQLKQLLEYNPKSITEERSKGYWFFCYLCNGMNFQDVGLLQFKNIQGNTLSFIRCKTRNTLTERKEIKVHLHPLAIEIIERWGNKSKEPDDYIFGIVNDDMLPFHKQQTLNRYKKISNHFLSKIGRELKFPHPLNLSLARHSFVTFHKLYGTPTSFIQDALGHQDSKTTQHYLKQLPDENLKQMTAPLLAF